MSYNKSSSSEQVGYNLLAERTKQLSNLGFRASNSFLRGNTDDYFYTLISLRQQLTPNLNPNETRVLNKIEDEIHALKLKAIRQIKVIEKDEPGHHLIHVFKKQEPMNRNYNSEYVEKIKKFEQALLIVMKKKGFYPGKTDASSIS